MTTQQRGEETRNRILDAALQTFARSGYDAASVSEICRQAGVTKGGFYHHFSSKQALFLELLERWLGEIDDQLEAARFEGETIPKGLMQMTRMVEGIFQDASGRLPIFLEFATKAWQSSAVWQATVVPFRKYHNFFARLIKDGIAEGSLRNVDADVVSRVFLSFAIGFMVQGLLDPQGADWGHVAQEGMGVLLQGLEQK